ncbi:MAG: leucyl aminopeptidase [Alphaproteobacteria bacterium]|nr:leucyl aminopeptidase [Alphaproteobacteria bacterium]MDE2110313.1 leucyl aminopeptidase [Alphaproteobacteria bacterium]MDE2494852.1 leucyl aminopeptidase [Alphaproteobacteria bacterium]
MQLSFAAPSAVNSGTWVVGALEGPTLLPAAAKADKATGGAIGRGLPVNRFTGKPGQVLEVLAPAGLRISRILVVGLGKPENFDANGAEAAAAAAVGRLKGTTEAQIAFEIDTPKGGKVKGAQIAAHLAMGAKLKTYAFNHYRTKDLAEHESKLQKVTVFTADPAAAKKAWEACDAVVEGMFLARDLVNEPPNVLSPVEFGRRAKALAKLGLKVEVLGEAQMKKLGMGALLGVGQGSERESQLVVLQWNGARKKAASPVAFVGKGVCFDSGGLSLKTGQGMMGMKGDMGGAAAVTGAMRALAVRKAKVNAVGVIGLVENMPDGKAQRPDDVVKSMSGQTVEVLNTDAEGRLVLADALWYAQTRFKPRFVIDLATLTGAILVALGGEHAGLFSNDDKLSERLSDAGKAVGEPVWRLPLGKGYDKLLRSKIADMKNIGGPSAGSITAAQFLQRFVQEKTPWAHLDIAGVAWQDNEQKPLIPSWGTGWGVRILDRLVKDHYEG